MVIATHNNVPQSGSRKAAVRMRAASAGVGGLGFSFGAAGGSPCATGDTATQRQRTAFLYAPDRMKCMCRIVVAP
ncbi:hypothetical protein SAMN05443637_105278 [Pseudonocardia thermophila]|uniref:Uncharacterized protein n=1 Tax=Pseudonocardia thermophila TaxID=1848 RepID=A0A1M6S271_PSETH|nr:hypothetical protein SAMN05443637_105278 [Pseudonocardia thermophila]